MKKYLSLLLIFTVAFFGCKKGEDKEASMEYSINGLSNITYKFAKLTIPVELKHLSGPQEAVNLSVSGLPAGMKSVLSTTSGTPTFGTFIELTNTAPVAKGTYPLKFSAITNSGKSKTIDFNLIVDENCSESLKGDYTSIWNNNESNPYNYTVKTKSDVPNRLYFHYNNAATAEFYADVNCSTGTLIIPSQPYDGIGSDVVSGNGTFTSAPNTILMSLTDAFSTIPVRFTAK